MQKRLFGLSLVAVMLATACGGTQSSSSAPSGAASAPASAAPSATDVTTPSAAPVEEIDITAASSNYKKEEVGNTGGKLVYGISGEPTSLWYGAYDNFSNNVSAFGPSLWGLWNNTGDLKYYGQLATNVPTTGNGGVTLTDSGGMDVKIDLNPGGMWSDGQPITCDDLKYMWEWTMDPTQVGLISGTAGWTEITAIDGGTGVNCVVHFKTEYSQYLSLWTPLLPAHYLKTVPVADASTKLYTHAKPEDVATGVFSGPYSPSIWTAGSQLDYVPNAKFWETIRPGTAPFDSVTFKFYADPQTEIAGFQNDEIDVALEFNQNHLPLMSAIDPASIQKDLGVTWEHTSWNLARLTEQFGEAGAKAVIQALHYAIDKEEINQRIANGGVTPVCNNNVPGVWWYKEIPCVPYDVAKANEILDAAGFVTGTDGVRTLDGKPLEIQSCTRADRQYRIDTQRLLADQLTKIGVKLNLDHVATDVAVLFSSWEGADAAPADAPCNLTRGNFGVTEFAWVGTPDPTSGQFQYMSKYNPSLGDHTGQNYIRVNIPEVDKIFETATTTVDLTKIKPLMEEFQDIFVNVDNAFPEIPLYNWTTVLIRKPTMHNVVNNSSAATQTWNIEDWWRAAS